MINRNNAIKQLSEMEKRAKPIKLAAEKWDRPWKTLIATIMSARTRDEKTIPVARELFKQYPTLKSLSMARLFKIQNVIKSVNFYKNKAKNILDCANLLVSKYNSRVPIELNELIKLPGVGKKTANVFLSVYGHPAIGVDTHVYYISRRLEWSRGDGPEEVERDLKELFPKKYWGKINPVLVRFGKTHTKKREKEYLLLKIKNRR